MSTVQINILNELAVRINGELIETFPTVRVKAMLLLLATQPGYSMGRRQIASLLWSEVEDSAARRNLRGCLFRLRKLIGEENVVASRQSIELVSAESDYHTFQTLAQSKKQADWRTAVGLMNGELAGEFTLKNAPLFEEWLKTERQSAIQKKRDLINKLLAAETEDQTARLQFAQQLVEIDPYDEIAHRHIMLAYAALENVGAALAHFDQYAETLRVEVSAEPDNATINLRDKLLRAANTKPAKLFNLPAQVTAFVGRDDERNAVVGLLEQPSCRMVTLLGVGGMGKTRLSVEVAQQFTTELFPDGVYFVPLVTATTQLDVLAQIHSSLVITTQGGDIKAQVFDYLQDKQLLLVLDNLEQVTSELRFLAGLLQKAAGVKILATSRHVIGISAEHRFPLSGIGNLLDASELLWRAIQRISPDFELNATNMALGAKICEQLHGVPLALELAATWINTLDLDAIREEIEHAFDFLESPLLDTPDRHRSLSAIFDHSWDLLTPKHQAILSKASIFRGGFEMRAARPVLGAGMHDLRRLVEQSMLVKGEHNRYLLHELVRQFATEKLSPTDEDGVRKAHANYYLALPATNERKLVGENALVTSELISADLANITSAWRWTVSNNDTANLTAAVTGMTNFYRLTGRFAEGDQLYVETIEQLGQQVDDTLLAQLHIGCSHFRMWQSRHEESVASGELALTAAKRTDSNSLIAESHLAIARGQRVLGNLMMAIPIFQQGLAACASDATVSVTADSTHAIRAEILGNLGLISAFSTDREAGVELAAMALLAAKQSGNKMIEAFTLSISGYTSLRIQHLSDVLRFTQKGIGLAQSLGNPIFEAASLISLAGAKVGLGMVDEAVAALEQARQIYRAIGDNLGEIFSYHGLCQALYGAGEYEKALHNTNIALPLSKARGISLHHGYLQYWHGINLLNLGQLDAAEQAFEKSIQGRVALNLPSRLDHNPLFGLGEVALARSVSAPIRSEYVARALALTNDAINDLLGGYIDPNIYRINCLSGYKILKANDDPRAERLLQLVYEHIMKTADTIEDPAHRQSYFEQNRLNRELLAIYNQR